MDLTRYVLPAALLIVALAALAAALFYVCQAFVESRVRDGIASLLAIALGVLLFAGAKYSGWLEAEAGDIGRRTVIQLLILVVVGAAAGYWVGQQWRRATVASLWWSLTLLSCVGFVTLDFALSGNAVAHLPPALALLAPGIAMFLVASGHDKANLADANKGDYTRQSPNRAADSESRPGSAPDRDPF
jgi:hypothetical protein